MIKIYFLLLVIILMACAPQKEVTKEVSITPGPIVEVPITPPALTHVEQVEAIIADKNTFRLLSGSTPLTKGLTCTVHVSNNPDLTANWPSASHTFTLTKEFNQPDSSGSIGTNILPVALQSIYINNYRIRCQGQIVITESAYYLFKLSSDDGSMLYIDNSLLINNNHNHGMTTITGSRLLEKGVHVFRLDYGQTGAGNMGLILEYDSGIIPAYTFYR